MRPLGFLDLEQTCAYEVYEWTMNEGRINISIDLAD